MRKNDALQILRAVAALLVVYLHSLYSVETLQTPRQAAFYHLQNFGACGVDIFFTISGFILSMVALRTKPEKTRVALDFLIRRYIRILPIYWIISLFSVAFELRHRLLTLSWTLSSYLLLPSLSYPLRPPLLIFGWTLMFEMFFYYVLSFNLLFGKTAIVQRAILCILALIGLGAIINFQRPILILIANPMNIEFVLGCCIALIYSRLGKRPAFGTILIWLGALAFGITIIHGYGRIDQASQIWNGHASWHRVLLWGLPAAILTAGIIFRPGEIRSSFGKLWVYLGDASYSIYLSSVVVFYLFERFSYLAAGIPPDLNVFLCMLLATVVGAATYSIIEHPITQFIVKKYQQKKEQAPLKVFH